MKTATDIAEDMAQDIFDFVLKQPEVQKDCDAIRGAEGSLHKAGHVIDAAGFTTSDAEIAFDGEFDVHFGHGGDDPGHPARRINASGLLRQVAGTWDVASVTVESIATIDAESEADELP